MIIVTKMQMKGFKSFANRTEIVFGDHFNCVLGPNGSGKSNILDSLCFVLGKSGAKGLRAEKSANLIYNGGKSKKPAKEGEVSIWFSNPDNIFGLGGDELKITRIIRHSGQSIYKINDKTMTRQQILEVLGRARINPDGYNIILQGDIIRLVEMSTIDRRKVVEEIAGISMYEEKKEKALRELQRVDERLNEADIILAERATYLKELKSERDQALKFKELDDKIKRNKATLLDTQMTSKQSDIDTFNKKIVEAQQKITEYKNESDKLRSIIEKSRSEIETINEEVERKGEKEQVALHKEVEKLKVDLAVNKQRMTTIDTELDKLSVRRSELEKSFGEISEKLKLITANKKDLQTRIASKEKELSQIDQRIKQFKEKNKIEDAAGIDSRMEEIDKEADLIAEDIAKFREQQQNILREKDRLEMKLQGIDEKIYKVQGLEKEHKEALDDLKNKKASFKQITVELSKSLNEDSSFAAQLSNARTKLLARQEEHNKLHGQQMRIRESVAGGTATNAILELNKKGVHGLVSDIAQVKSEYALALEVASGARSRSIVVDDDKIAADCIEHLKKNRLGVATFLPLNKLKTVTIDSSLQKLRANGVHGLALDLLTYDKKFSSVFEYVFGNTLVVDDVEVARRIGIGKARMVTLSGDLMETSGAMQGGHRQVSKGLAFQNADLTKKMEKLEAEIADQEAVISRLAQEKSDNESVIERLRHKKSELEGEIIKLEKSLHIDSADIGASKDEKKKFASELKELDKEYDALVDELSSKNRALANLKIEKQKLRDRINALRSPALLAELNSFEEKKSELKDAIGKLTVELRTSDAESLNILGPEGENIKRILKQHEKEESSFRQENKELNSLILLQEKELVQKEKQQKAFYEQFKELFNKRSKLTEDANRKESHIMLLNEKSRTQETTMNTASLEQARLKAEFAGLQEEFKQYEGVELFSSKPVETIKREISQFEKMVSDIGAVNMKALEMYDRIQTEYEKLIVKKQSLGGERENVLLMINEVDTKKKELFMRTYDLVNQNFKRLFNSLSTKGEATLELEDPKEVFNGGLTLKVRITGSKYLDIRSLSGGEKTLTALAFIFSVQEHDPAPFYILDEVDAALDKKNSERLAKLVKNYSKNSQYIMISHNDGVISEADTLYGISMNEHGMSKVTSLKI